MATTIIDGKEPKKEHVCRDCKKPVVGISVCEPCHAIMLDNWMKQQEKKYDLHPFKPEVEEKPTSKPKKK